MIRRSFLAMSAGAAIALATPAFAAMDSIEYMPGVIKADLAQGKYPSSLQHSPTLSIPRMRARWESELKELLGRQTPQSPEEIDAANQTDQERILRLEAELVEVRASRLQPENMRWSGDAGPELHGFSYVPSG